MNNYRNKLRDAGISAETSLTIAMAADRIHSALSKCDLPTREIIKRENSIVCRLAREFGQAENLNAEF